MANIENELKIIKDNFEELITMFGSGSEDNPEASERHEEYQKLTKTIEQFPTQISYYIGNINDTLIKQNPDAKQIITLLIPKDDNTIIQGVLHKK